MYTNRLSQLKKNVNRAHLLRALTKLNRELRPGKENQQLNFNLQKKEKCYAG